MSNYFLKTEQKITVTAALAEGNSIRSIERMTGIHRDTIMRLGVRIGQGCARLMDTKMRNLDCQRLELDEVWGFIAKKSRHVQENDDPTYGDVWTYCAIDADTKLVPSYYVASNRSIANTTIFISDLAKRLNNRVQISTDAMNSYEEAIETVFGVDVDYAQIVKTYQSEDGREYNPERRYSQPRISSSKKRVFTGIPERALISTSYVERLNASTRLHMKRLARVTHAFSKKFENFEAAVGLNFAAHNFVKTHRTLKMTPAMAAGVERSFWSYGDLVEAVEAQS
jgi:IS1 family transposase